MKNYFLMFSTMIGLMLAVGERDARAALIHSLANDPTHIAWADDRDYVLPLFRGSDFSNLAFAGSMTVIDDGQWGLFARHQALQNYSDVNSVYNAIGVKAVGNANDSGSVIKVSDVFVFEDRDMALVRFENPIAGITPIQRYRGEVTVGMEGYITGYGDRQVVNDPNVVFTGDRRTGFDVVQAAGSNFFVTRINDPFSPNYREYEIGGRTSSSGGSFEFDSQLAGSLFGGTGPNSNILGTGTFYNYIPNDRIDLIQSNYTAVPEPTSFALVGISVLALGTRLRKKQVKNHGVQIPVTVS